MSPTNEPASAVADPIRPEATVDLTVNVTALRSPSAGGAEPVSLGVPFPRGAVFDVATLRLTHAGIERPVQATVLNTWSDGSVRWALLDFMRAPADRDAYRVTTDVSLHDGVAGEPVRVLRTTAGVVCSVGPVSFVFAPGSGFPFSAVRGASGDLLRSTRLEVLDGHDRPCQVEIDRVDVEASGPVKAVVRLEGSISANGQELLRIIARVTCYAGLPTARLALTLRNPKRAEHPGGFWELGDSGSVLLREASVCLSLPDPVPASAWCSSEPAGSFDAVIAPFTLYQDSSGGEHWQSPVHLDRDGAIVPRFRGYRAQAGETETSGLRATPHLIAAGISSWASIAVPQFWQNFPKALSYDGRTVRFGLWPREAAGLHEIQGGEQKTHVCYISVGAGQPDPTTIDWPRCETVGQVTPEWYERSGAVRYLTSQPGHPGDGYEALIASAIEGIDSFAAKAERIDEFGWRHFGDLYADHEAAFDDGPAMFVSHYNNQYDAVYGFARQFMRTGDRRWRALMDDLAHHVVDIDIYHTDQDKAAYNHGLFWHTSHYVAAGRSTHRSYPHAEGVPGGGLSNEHNYGTGLMLHHFLTGDPLSRETVIGLADWVVEMDNGRRTVFKWLAGGDTGLASQTVSDEYHGPGRGAGHSIKALLDGHVLTGERRYLEKAEQLIRRTIHPDDRVADRSLLDRERRWSYTAYLQALGIYLDHKAELGELDAMYAYARAALLQYARWMVDHEYPYLDRPEELEYPTETWAAQEARKSEAFDYAARHGSAAERERFLERARFFWTTALTTLARFPSRTTARPLVLMTGHGFLRGYMRAHPADAAPAPGQDPRTIPPTTFASQKRRAIARARRLILAGAVAAIFSAGALLWFLLT